MAMSEDIRDDEEFESGTSVEVEDDQVDDTDLSLDDDEDESRTNVRNKSSGDDELDNYSDSVKRRINQLTAKRKQASEEAQAAYEYADKIQKENESMKTRLQQVSAGYNSEAEGRLKAQEAQATRAYAEASEAGDYDRAAKAQQALAQIAVAKDKVRSQKTQIERQGQEQEQQQQQQQQQVQQQPQQQQQAAPARDRKLDSWLDKNSWFGNDRIMTRTAQAIHETLVLEEDYDPTSDDYYKEIDSRMRKEMPQKFKEKRSNAQTVAPASGNGRSIKSGRKKSVELSPGQVAFAKKMRIPLEKYAREVAKIDNRRSE
jgi:DNA repair exonuclease SbcCD ATPase subunit